MYRRKTARYPMTPEIFNKAKSLLQSGLSKRGAAKEVGFSEATLRKRLKMDCGVRKLGRFNPSFNAQQELEILDHVAYLERMFCGLTITSLRKLAFEYARVNNIPNRFSQKTEMAGKDWASTFLRKYKLSLRKPLLKGKLTQTIEFEKMQVELYFDNLQSLIKTYRFSNSRIFSMDESELPIFSNDLPKVFSLDGQGRIASEEENQSVTVVCCMSATGYYLPPAIIFPAKTPEYKLINGGPPNSILFVSESGCINSQLFLEWLKHFQSHVKPSETDPTLLILDNHPTHTSLATVLYARKHNIHMVFLPLNNSHRIQPLDCFFFKTLKFLYYQACERWLINNPGRVLSKYEVSSLFDEAYQKSVRVDKAENSFRTCGIWPLNPSLFIDPEFIPFLEI